MFFSKMLSKNCLLRTLLFRPTIKPIKRNLFIISIEYKVPIEKIDKHLAEHRQFLQNFYDNKTFLVSGKKIPRTGGIIIASIENKKELEKIIEKDPFYKNQLARYDITEFVPSMFCNELSEVVKIDFSKKPLSSRPQ